MLLIADRFIDGAAVGTTAFAWRVSRNPCCSLATTSREIGSAPMNARRLVPFLWTLVGDRGVPRLHRVS